MSPARQTFCTARHDHMSSLGLVLPVLLSATSSASACLPRPMMLSSIAPINMENPAEDEQAQVVSRLLFDSSGMIGLQSSDDPIQIRLHSLPPVATTVVAQPAWPPAVSTRPGDGSRRPDAGVAPCDGPFPGSLASSRRR